jgi:MoaA/NifB/PqqE/SkfB family radical SAM enzyme
MKHNIFHYIGKAIQDRRLFNNYCKIAMTAILQRLHMTSALPPLWLQIETVCHCNLKCPLCRMGRGTIKREKGQMSLDVFKKIIDDVARFKPRICLWHMGEPLLTKNLPDYIDYAKGRGIPEVVISTNGSVDSSQEFALSLVRAGLDRIIICIDGADQAALEQYRKGSTFATVTALARNLVEARKSIPGSTISIIVSFIIMKHNEHQIEDMKVIARELGVDELQFRNCDIYLPDRDIVELSRDYLPEEIKSDLLDYDSQGNLAYAFSLENRCDWLWKGAVISREGKVLPCCHDVDALYPLGDITIQPFLKIWNGPSYRNFRKKLLNDRKSLHLCSLCPEGAGERLSVSKDKLATWKGQ